MTARHLSPLRWGGSDNDGVGRTLGLVALVVAIISLWVQCSDARVHQAELDHATRTSVKFDTYVDELEGIVKILVHTGGPAPAHLVEAGVICERLGPGVVQPWDVLKRELTRSVQGCYTQTFDYPAPGRALPPWSDTVLFVFAFRDYAQAYQRSPDEALRQIEDFKTATRGMHLVMRYTPGGKDRSSHDHIEHLYKLWHWSDR